MDVHDGILPQGAESRGLGGRGCFGLCPADAESDRVTEGAGPGGCRRVRLSALRSAAAEHGTVIQGAELPALACPLAPRGRACLPFSPVAENRMDYTFN